MYGNLPHGLWLYISILEQCHIQHVLYYVYVNFPHDCGSMTHATCVCTCVPEGSSLEGLLTVGPIDGRESGGGWLSTTRGLLEANFFAAVADIGECNISTTNTIIISVCACVRACVRVCVHACVRTLCVNLHHMHTFNVFIKLGLC